MHTPKGSDYLIKRVQFVLTETEYEELKERANKIGVSISKYVKDCVFSKNSCSQKGYFEEIWEEFSMKVSEFPIGIEFDVSTIMTQERWRSLDRSTKLSIARLFNKKVAQSDEFPEIEIIGRSPSNVTLYRKKHI